MKACHPVSGSTWHEHLLCVCVCVFACVCVRARACARARAHACVRACLCVCAHARVLMCACTQVCARTRVSPCLHVCPSSLFLSSSSFLIFFPHASCAFAVCCSMAKGMPSLPILGCPNPCRICQKRTQTLLGAATFTCEFLSSLPSSDDKTGFDIRRA